MAVIEGDGVSVIINIDIWVGKINFTQIDLPLDLSIPFARVTYVSNGKIDYLRYDLGKQVFIDHLDNGEEIRVSNELSKIMLDNLKGMTLVS